MIRRVFRFLLRTLLLAFLAAGGAAFLLLRAIRAPYKGYAAPSVLVEIPSGSSSVSVFAALERGGVLRDRRLGLIALKVFHRGRTIKAGEYRFRGERSPEQVVLSLVSGDVVTYRVTIPEGLTAAEIGALLAGQRFGTEADYAELIARPADFRDVPAGAPSLEGFLFPDTYTFTRVMTPREIVGRLVREFFRRLPPGFRERAAAGGMTVLSAVTLASIVEKETAVPAERGLVAAVYRNRLAKGMLLQADPTTLYALRRLGRFGGTLLRADLNVDEPYNTYVRPGLPPGPICNPGLAALRAAVDPEKVPYLYFVAAGDGSHLFATDYADQQRNVARYRARRRAGAR